MSHTLMMKRILEEDVGLGRGYCPSRLYPLCFGRSCSTANARLRAALPKLNAPNKTGWKETANSVAASLLGQQKVSSRGDAMSGGRGRERGTESGLQWRDRRRKKERKRLGT